MQNFWKSVKIWQSYREFQGGNFFLRHSVVSQCKIKEFRHQIETRREPLEFDFCAAWQLGRPSFSTVCLAPTIDAADCPLQTPTAADTQLNYHQSHNEAITASMIFINENENGEKRENNEFVNEN